MLTAQDLQWRDALGVPRLAGVSLTLRAGEIVGIAGVSGNGQSELLEMLSGMGRPQSGTLILGGRRFDPARWLDPSTGVRGPGHLVLGPEPLIGPQQVILTQSGHPEHALRVATDGLRPFAVSSAEAAQ